MVENKKKLVWLPALLLLLTACTNNAGNIKPAPAAPVTRVVGIGKVIPPGGVSELAAPASGIVTGVRFNTGDTVKAGDILLLIDETDETLAVREADSRVASRGYALAAARAQLQQEKLALTEKSRLLNDARELLEVGAATGEETRVLQNEYDWGVEQLKKLESDIETRQAEVEEAIAQRASRLSALERRQFRAPVDGILLDVIPRVGESVDLYQTYARVSPGGPLIILAEVDELFANKLSVGQRCTIMLTDSVLSADEEILRVSPDLKRKSLFSDSGNDLEDRRVREVEISLRYPAIIPLIDTRVECVIILN